MEGIKQSSLQQIALFVQQNPLNHMMAHAPKTFLALEISE